MLHSLLENLQEYTIQINSASWVQHSFMGNISNAAFICGLHSFEGGVELNKINMVIKEAAHSN